MITRDGIGRFFEQLYEIDSLDDRITSPNTLRFGFLPLNIILGVVPTYIALTILGQAYNAAISLLVIFLVGPLIGSVVRKLIVGCYRVLNWLVALIPKDEEEAYLRRAARLEKQKNKRKGDGVRLAAYGDEQYQVVEEAVDLSAKKK